MPTPIRSLARSLASEDGLTIIEYAVMLGLVVVAALSAVMAVGSTGSGLWKPDADRIVAVSVF